MNMPPTRGPALPWQIALVAAAMTLLLRTVTIAILWNRFGDSLQLEWTQELTTACIEPLVAGSLSFFVVQWLAERDDVVAYRRPWRVLAVFGLLFPIVTTLLGTLPALVVQALDASIDRQTMRALLIPYAIITSLIVPLLSWWPATRLLRADAVAATQPWPRQRGRAVGLYAAIAVGWVALVAHATMTDLPGLRLSSLEPLEYLRLWLPLLVPTALLSLGARLGLPSGLRRIHCWRLMGALVLALASEELVLHLITPWLTAMVSQRDQTWILLSILGMQLVNMVFWSWLWTWIFYRSLPTQKPLQPTAG